MDILQKFIFGEVFTVGNLDNKQRELITCTVLSVMQTLPQLKSHAAAALNVGVTPVELREAIYQCAPDHLLYGSDYPYQPDQVLKAGLERMRAWMSEDPSLASLLSGILYGNAVALFDKPW